MAHELYAAHLPRICGVHDSELRAPRSVRGSFQFSIESTLVDVRFHIGRGQRVVPYIRAIFEQERLPEHAFASVLSTFVALLEHDAGRPRDLCLAMRNVATLQQGLEVWRLAVARRGPTTLELFSAAHLFLARVIHEGAHLAELERSFRDAREELSRDAQTQIRILQDTHSHELAHIAASNDAPSDELLESHTLQMRILTSKFERLAHELSAAQRDEYQQFVLQFANIEWQTPQSRRMLATSTRPSPSPLAAENNNGNGVVSPLVSRKPFVARTASRSSSGGITVASPKLKRKDSASQVGSTSESPTPEVQSEWIESEFLRTTMTVLLDDDSVTRLSLVALPSISFFSQKRLDSVGLLRAVVVCDRLPPSSLPELHFEESANGDGNQDSVASQLYVSKHSNMPSCDVVMRIQCGSLDEPSLSLRREQARSAIATLRRALSLCHSVGTATVSVPLLLLDKRQASAILLEDGGAGWVEHARGVVACVKEALLWSGKDEDALRHVRFYLPANLSEDVYLQATEIVRTPFIKK
jgi:hypothetical protein